MKPKVNIRGQDVARGDVRLDICLRFSETICSSLVEKFHVTQNPRCDKIASIVSQFSDYRSSTTSFLGYLIPGRLQVLAPCPCALGGLRSEAKLGLQDAFLACTHLLLSVASSAPLFDLSF